MYKVQLNGHDTLGWGMLEKEIITRTKKEAQEWADSNSYMGGYFWYIITIRKDYHATYQAEKEKARAAIIDYSMDQLERAMSWGEIASLQNKIIKLARRYGLIKELKNEGIL